MISLISVDISSNLSDHWWAIWNIFLFIIILCQQIQSIFQRKNQIPFVSWLVHFWCISQSNTIPRGTKINHHNPMLLTASAIGSWIETFNIGITAIIIIWISIHHLVSCLSRFWALALVVVKITKPAARFGIGNLKMISDLNNIYKSYQRGITKMIIDPVKNIEKKFGFLINDF